MEKLALAKNFHPKRKWYDKLITGVLIVAFIIAFAYATFVVIFIEIKVIGTSMQPTYNAELPINKSDEYYEKSKIQDKVFVNRFDKGKRGDIIIVKTGKINSDGSQKSIIKRLIGIAGDKVDIKKYPAEADDLNANYYLYLNGVRLKESYIKSRIGMASAFAELRQYKIENGIDIYDPIVVPKDRVFILGDNREISDDSSKNGPAYKVEDIIGKVAFCVKYNQNIFQYFWNSIFGT